MFKEWKFNYVQKTLLLIHFIAILIGFHPSARITGGLIKCPIWTWIWYPCLGLISMGLYALVSQGPGYAEDVEPMPENDPAYYFCSKCQKTIPIRCVHCNTCGRCCLRKDHHCPWLGICIGMNNHFFFILLLIFEIFFCFGLMFIVSPGIQDDMPYQKWLYTSLPLSIVYYGVIFVLLQPFLLLPIHFYLICTDMTTREYIKKNKITYLKKWNHMFSPYSQGLFSNIKNFVLMRWTHPIYRPILPEDEENWNNLHKYYCNL